VIVPDASALLEVLLRSPAGLPLAERLLVHGETLHVPHLVDLEIAQVLRRYLRQGELDGERGRQVLADLADFPLERYPHAVLLPRIWQLRENLTASDAAYVALAEILDATILTSDRRLAASTGHSARIEVV
jgi:predicted nucleic acid-binding protein